VRRLFVFRRARSGPAGTGFPGSNQLPQKPQRPEAAEHSREAAEEQEGGGQIPALQVTPQWNRLESEFDVLRFLGRGGFGDVLKVRNKLDGCVYAIKRVLLQPSRKDENRKITREVKLLSRLNHENVVRCGSVLASCHGLLRKISASSSPLSYYNSWIERGMEVPDSSASNSASSTLPNPKPNPSETAHNAAIRKKKSVGNLCRSCVLLEWFSKFFRSR